MKATFNTKAKVVFLYLIYANNEEEPLFLQTLFRNFSLIT